MSSLHLAAKSGNLDILKILMSSRDTDIDAQVLNKKLNFYPFFFCTKNYKCLIKNASSLN